MTSLLPMRPRSKVTDSRRRAKVEQASLYQNAQPSRLVPIPINTGRYSAA